MSSDRCFVLAEVSSLLFIVTLLVTVATMLWRGLQPGHATQIGMLVMVALFISVGFFEHGQSEGL